MPPRVLTTEQEKVIINRYLLKETPKDISVDYGVHQDTIYNVLRRNNIPRRTRHDRTFPVKHDSFDKLTEESLYWAGFIAADGHINDQTGNTVSRVMIRLAIVDKQHLVKFKEFLQADKSAVSEYISKTPAGFIPACRITVRSKNITDRLKSFGLKGPVLSPDISGSRHFWRGVIDGDGYLSKNPERAALELAGQPYMLEPYMTFLKDNLEIDSRIVPNGRGYTKVKSGGRTASRIIDYLYDDNVISLDRKQTRADAIRDYYRGRSADQTQISA